MWNGEVIGRLTRFLTYKLMTITLEGVMNNLLKGLIWAMRPLFKSRDSLPVFGMGDVGNSSLKQRLIISSVKVQETQHPPVRRQ